MMIDSNHRIAAVERQLLHHIKIMKQQQKVLDYAVSTHWSTRFVVAVSFITNVALTAALWWQ